MSVLKTCHFSAVLSVIASHVRGHHTQRYCFRLRFIITSSLSSLLPMRALCGLINKPFVLHTRPIGAQVAGVQKIVSNSTCKSANSALFLTLFRSVMMVCGCLPFVSLHERQRVTHTAISYTDCFKNARSPQKFSRTLKSEDKDKDLQISPR